LHFDPSDTPGEFYFLPGLVALLLYVVYKFPRWTYGLLERPLYHVPFARKTLMQAGLAPVCEVLAMLLKAGTPLPRAIEQAESLHVPPNLRRTLRRMHTAVEQGESLGSAARKQRRCLPASFAAMVALGERAAALPGALAYLSDLYADNTRMRQHVLGQMLFPAMILVLGAVVLFVQIAMFELIWGISDVLFYSL